MEDTILYSSCFDANTGLFETILSKEDAIFSDALNHASIIDGVRLCKAARFRYGNNDMEDLGRQLESAGDARRKLIVTDGVFSMDGYLADLPAICNLADQHESMLMVDDSHAVGFMGKNGREPRIPRSHGTGRPHDGTLGKAPRGERWTPEGERTNFFASAPVPTSSPIPRTCDRRRFTQGL